MVNPKRKRDDDVKGSAQDSAPKKVQKAKNQTQKTLTGFFTKQCGKQ